MPPLAAEYPAGSDVTEESEPKLEEENAALLSAIAEDDIASDGDEDEVAGNQ
jgi:hypothetical protein